MSKSEDKGTPTWVTILLALIPVIGGLLTVYLQNQPELTAMQLTATADARLFSLTAQALTAQAGGGLPTAGIATATPRPGDTPVPPTTAAPPTQGTTVAPPRPYPGDDLQEGCISKTFWAPFASGEAGIVDQGSCWEASAAGIYASQGWRFSVHQPATSVVAFYTDIGSHAGVSFDLQATQLEAEDNNAQIDLFFGFASEENNLAQGEFLVLRKTGNNKIYLVSSESATGESYASYGRYTLGDSVQIRLLRNGNFITLSINGVTQFADKALPSDQLGNLFWVGYSIPQNADAEVQLSNFLITP